MCSGALLGAKQAVRKLLLIAIKIAEPLWEKLEMNIKQECSKASFVKVPFAEYIYLTFLKAKPAK